MGDARVPVEAIFEAFEVDAIVTRPGQDPITDTSVVWVNPATDVLPVGASLAMADPQRVLTVRRDEVPSLPLGTLIEAPEIAGGPVRTWKVDNIERYEADLIRAQVIPSELAS